MKNSILSIILGTIGFGATAQTTFQSQTSGTFQDLEGIHYLSASTKMWAVGAGGTILTSADQGSSWTAQTSGVTATLEDVTFLITGNQTVFGWTCGSSGTILTTSDEGATWQVQSQGAPYTMFAVDFQDFANGIVVGDGFYARTSNGGNVWSPTMISNTFRAVDYVSSTTGWICGDNGLIMKTTDGGANWTTQTSGTTVGLHGIDFINTNEGWACGYTGTILHTTDGGTTWTAQTSNSANLLSDIHFTDALNGWACGYTGTILHTTNGGTTWTFHASNETGTVAWLSNLTLKSANEGWAVGEVGTIVHFTSSTSNVGMEETPSVSINVYPNPATSQVTIESDADIELVEVYTLSGENVLTSKQATLSIEELVVGTYIIKVVTNQGTIQQRFIKK